LRRFGSHLGFCNFSGAPQALQASVETPSDFGTRPRAARVPQ
jgi:hypothetical protein